MSANLTIDELTGRVVAASNPDHGRAWWEREGMAPALVPGGIHSVEHLRRILPIGDVTKVPMLAQTASGPMAVDGHYVTVRDIAPTLTDDGVVPGRSIPLGPVGGRYAAAQTSEMVEIALASGRPLSFFVMLDNWRREVASVKLDSLVIDPGGIADKLDRFVNVFNDHTGMRHLMACSSTVRVVCANTEAMALQSGDRIHKLRHTVGKITAAELAQFRTIVAEATDAGAEVVAAAEAMLTVPGGSALNVALDVLAPVDDDMSKRGQTRRGNVRDAIADLAHGDLNESLTGWNGWAVYNAVTEYLDHHRTVRNGGDSAAEQSAARIVAAMDPMSDTADAKREVSGRILALAGI